MPYTYNTIHEQPFVFAYRELSNQRPLLRRSGQLYWLKSIGQDGFMWMPFSFEGDDELKKKLEAKSPPVIPLTLAATSGAGHLFLFWSQEGYKQMQSLIESVLLMP